ncbi:quinon protein alcohol dehydrogenase-like superfamily [Chaetomium sp. MPI-SDFR-AT-0129]|nr:quinon protein alcohol dehydrogenase-like superfamily [Chaetomium sp. MPI-SDFR-AT-0129]
MASDLPSRFATDLEESLNLRVPTAASDDQRSTTSTTASGQARPRQWDDPPDDEGEGGPGAGAASPAARENITTMVFVLVGQVRSSHDAEIMQLTYASANDAHLVAMVPKSVNARNMDNKAGPYGVMMWSATTGQRVLTVTGISGTRSGLRLARGGFAVKPVSAGGANPVVACPFYVPMAPQSTPEMYTMWTPRVEAFDLGRRERLFKQDVAIRAPLAYSPDGQLLAGVSERDPTRVMVIKVPPGENSSAYASIPRIVRIVMSHLDEVTKVAFLPAGAGATGGARALVSAGKDGQVRVTDIDSGRTLKKVEVLVAGARFPASILQVSSDGTLVVTVWGRDVVLWYLDTGRVHTYNLDAVRVNEGWPMAVSPDGRYLMCRNEEGFDVMEVQTGKFRGEFAVSGQPITSAAFNSTGTRLATGDYAGNLQIYEIVTSEV